MGADRAYQKYEDFAPLAGQLQCWAYLPKDAWYNSDVAGSSSAQGDTGRGRLESGENPEHGVCLHFSGIEHSHNPNPSQGEARAELELEENSKQPLS